MIEKDQISELTFVSKMLLTTLILCTVKIEDKELVKKIDVVCDEAKKILKIK